MKLFGASLILRHGSWEAEILPDYSMNVISLTYGGEAVLRSPDSEAEFRRNPIVFGTPFLMPPNRTENGRFLFEGVEYTLPINEDISGCNLHGLMVDAAFYITELSENQVSGTFINSGSRFPFPFCVTVQCSLSDKGCRQTFLFKNTGSGAMPLLFGLYTSFKERDRISVPLYMELERDNRNIPTGVQLPLSPENRAFTEGTGCRDKTISGYFTAAGHTAAIGAHRYTVSEYFTHWILWNGGGHDGFICIEPQSGPVNVLNRDHGYIRLEADMTVCFGTLIE